ncbi:Ribosomal large subunit pseudouridine synthase D [hydrothermal vent metagenome]|uniref:Ribosomal large subunit pseudouridine synthase D n=1 Tax=hydrothermal vent metagenome TaxID=652676 RepID=A0A3B1BXI2_9ZZZZ
MSESISLKTTIPEALLGKRLDQALADLFPDYSRSRLQKWLKEGQITLNGEHARAREKVYGGEEIIIQAQLEEEGDWEAEAIPLDIIFEDEHILVINKPSGLVVHPAAGNRGGTMLNALLHHAPELAQVPRAGIVHRLDKDTSGLLVVARTLPAQKYLVEQLQARAFLREYLAVINGSLVGGGHVDAPIGRHPVQRKRMAVVETGSGKEAITHYRIEERFRHHNLLKLRLQTGRTHQIRVHMAHIQHPLLGDPVYGGRLKLPPKCSDRLAQTLRQFRRQALHAAHLGLQHPASGEPLEWEAPMPTDMERLLNVLREDSEQTDDF